MFFNSWWFIWKVYSLDRFMGGWEFPPKLIALCGSVPVTPFRLPHSAFGGECWRRRCEEWTLKSFSVVSNEASYQTDETVMDEMSLPYSPLCTLITTSISHLSETKEGGFLQNDNDFHARPRPRSSASSGRSRLSKTLLPCLTAPADYIKSSMCSNSSCSLNSENPYATIRDPPALACKHADSSYVEMKSPSHREVPFGGTATLLGSAGRNVYDVGECVVALVRGAQQGSVAFLPAAQASWRRWGLQELGCFSVTLLLLRRRRCKRSDWICV